MNYAPNSSVFEYYRKERQKKATYCIFDSNQTCLGCQNDKESHKA